MCKPERALYIYILQMREYSALCTFLPSFCRLLSILVTAKDGDRIVQGDLELRADCNNSGSEAQSSLHWNPAGLSKQWYNFDSMYNFNIEYNCFNLSSTDHQVNTNFCLCTCVLLSTAKVIMHCSSYYWSGYSKHI